MFAKLAVVFALVAVACATSQFDAFLAKYKKSYTGAEYERRARIFSQTTRKIATARAEMLRNGQVPWHGVNEFSDMTREEFLQSGRVMKNKLLAADAISCLANGVTADFSKLNFDIPDAFDWTDKGVVSPIQNQEQCGSCWAFSTVSAIESAHAIKSGKLDKLSEQEIVDCSHGCVQEPPYGDVCNQGCSGGWPWSALTDIISWKGLATEDEYVYTAQNGVCKNVTDPINQIVNYTCLSGPGSADGPGYANETAMAAFLVANGPLSIAMDAGILQTYSSGIINPTTGECSKTSLDHAINIVGYGVDNGTPFWRVRNSWGTSWGEAGYFRIIRGKGACGLNAGVVFPLVA